MRRWSVVASVVLLLASTVTSATTLVKMDFDELSGKASRVVLGTVTDLDSHWDDTGAFVFTDVTIVVEQMLRGPGAGVLVVRTPGGQVGDFAVRAEGAPSFTVGEQVLLFLTAWDDGALKVLGYEQGKSTVMPDDRGVLRLRGGVVDGRTVEEVTAALHSGENRNIPLRPKGRN